MICPSAADTSPSLFARYRQLKAAATETEKLRVAGDAYKRELLQQKLSDTEWALSREQDRAKEAEAEKDGAATAAHYDSTKRCLACNRMARANTNEHTAEKCDGVPVPVGKALGKTTSLNGMVKMSQHCNCSACVSSQQAPITEMPQQVVTLRTCMLWF